MSPPPIRVAIIGSGCAAMTTAFELTRPELEGRYQVTIYQQGFRLGGKGASSRGPAGRIEEHGLHVWLGFYENAFRLMRDCYAELNRDPERVPIASWRDAFEPSSHVGIADWSPRAGWEPWTAVFPPLPGEPGGDFTRDNPYTVTGYLVRMLEVLRALLAAATQQVDEAGEAPSPTGIQKLATLLRYGRLAALAGVSEVVMLLDELSKGHLQEAQAPLSALLERLQGALVAERVRLTEGADDARRVWEVIDLVLAIFRGLVQGGTFLDSRGLDALDEYDVRDWLRRWGASEQSLGSGFVRGLYDLAFAFEAGDIDKPGIAAGQALRGALRFFFTYRGSFFWKMRAGMGEVVFAPLYEVLRRRGARFEFFNRLENVRLSAGDEPHVAALEFDVQARVRGAYEPLVDVGGLPCFPHEPDFSQLEDGERLRTEAWDFESFWDRRRVARKVLEVGRDFDFVVLGVGIGAVPHVCPEILARDQRWRDMCEHVKTVATQAGQAWLAEDLPALGWSLPSVTLSGFVEPFDTWADMSHLLPREMWPMAGREPKSLAYFCSVLPDPVELPARPAPGEATAYVAEKRAEVRANFARFLGEQVHHLWPKVRSATGDFRWQLLISPDPQLDGSETGAARVAQQYVSANVSPTDRFTLTLPGSTKFRISPLDATYDNLTIVGDWTACGFNESCVEAAVMSGRLGAHAIARVPRLEAIIGYDHP